MVSSARSTTAHTTVAHAAAGIVVANPSRDAITSAGARPSAEGAPAHVSQRSHCGGGFETVTDAVADDEATASAAEVDHVVPVAPNREIAGFRQVPRRHSRQVRGELQHGILQRVADVSKGTELVGP